MVSTIYDLHHSLFFLLLQNSFYLFMVMPGLSFCTGSFSNCSEWGLLLYVVGFLIVVASFVAEHRLWARARASAVAALALSSCGFRSLGGTLSICGAGAYLLRSLWNLPDKDRTCIPCTGRWILIHCSTREVHNILKKINSKLMLLGTSLAVHWLRLHFSTAGGMGLISNWIPHHTWRSQIEINKIK